MKRLVAIVALVSLSSLGCCCGQCGSGWGGWGGGGGGGGYGGAPMASYPAQGGVAPAPSYASSPTGSAPMAASPNMPTTTLR